MILQQETETTHVSKFQILPFSQPVGLGHHVELQTSGVEHRADVLADARDFASDTFESPAVASLSNVLLWCSSASPAST